MDPEGTSTAAQPDAPEQGAGGQGSGDFQGLYDLSAAPEELRPLLEQELKKVDANVTRRFQEHAEFRKRFEPLEGIDGLTDIPPDELTQLLQFRQVVGDEEQFANWWQAVGQELGFFDDGTPPEDEGGVDQLVAAAVQQAIAPLAARLEEFETRGQSEKAQQAAEQEIESQLAELREQHGEFDEEFVRRLARDYVKEPDFIRRGFEDYQRLIGQGQSQLVDDKLHQPAPAVNGGRPDTTTPQIRTFKEAEKAALARLGG